MAQQVIQAGFLATQVAFGTAAGVLLGLLIDHLAGTGPVFTLILMAIALVGSLIRFVVEAAKLGRPARDAPTTIGVNDENGPPPTSPG
ncbi:MAG: AtpZ/AtpI family protein [Planctomycetota bacterium]